MIIKKQILSQKNCKDYATRINNEELHQSIKHLIKRKKANK